MLCNEINKIISVLGNNKNGLFFYVHSLLTYGIIFWRTSSHVKSVFKIQKRIIRITTNSRSKDSWCDLFKPLNILPLHSQYIYSISVFVVMNRGLFKLNYDVHNIQTRQNVDMHVLSSKLTLFQKGVQYSGSKIFNHLPSSIKDLSNDAKSFKVALINFLLTHIFILWMNFFTY
jgi:hypothetical protein